MLKTTNRRIILVALLFAAIAALLTSRYLSSVDTGQAVAAPLKTGSVVVATQNIPPYTKLTAKMFQVKTMPSKYIEAGAATALKDVTGGISKSAIVQGEQVQKSRIYQPGQRTARFSFHIPSNMRAMSISVSSVSGVSGLIDVGDHVDLLLTVTNRQGAANQTSGSQKKFTTTLLQDLKILAVGSQIIPREDGKQQKAKTITLAVTPQQAQLIALAKTQGSYRLTLRSPVDQRTLHLTPTTIHAIPGEGG